MPASTAVFFDLDGTLVAPRTPFHDRVRATLPGDAPDRAVEAFATSLLDALECCRDDPFERAFAAVAAAHDLPLDPADSATAFVEREVAAVECRDGARRLVTAVADRHPTGILTNGDGPTQRRKADACGLAELVETVVVSNDVGARKPDPAVFAAAEQRLPADTHLYVGDTHDEDVVGAREAGWEAVYVGSETDQTSPPTVTAADVGTLGDVLVPLLAGD